jgi:hypothetical protein
MKTVNSSSGLEFLMKVENFYIAKSVVHESEAALEWKIN